MLIVLVGLCVEWALYHRDVVTRGWRGVSNRRPAARARERLMGIAFDAPLALLLLLPALGLTFALHARGAAADGHGPASGRAGRPHACC